MKKIPMLEKFAAQSLVECDGELIFSKEKFAELIVEECINVCKSRVGNSDYNTGRLHCVSDIRERFEFGMTTEDKKNLIKELLRVNK